MISGTTPGGLRPACAAPPPESGTARDGRWQCAWVLNQYAEPGVWTVGASVWDSAGKLDTLDTTLPVANTLADSTPPVLTGIAFPDGPATAGAETRPLSITGADSAAGMWRVEVWGVQGDPAYDWSCSMEAGVWPAGPPPSPDTWRPLVEYSPWGAPEAVPALAARLDDTSALVRGTAAWALGRIRTAPARAALAARRSREGDPWVQEEIALALGETVVSRAPEPRIGRRAGDVASEPLSRGADP